MQKVRASGYFQLDVGIVSEVVVIAGDDYTASTDDIACGISNRHFAEQCQLRVKQAGVGLTLGERLDLHDRRLRVLRRVVQVDREAIQIDVVAVRSIHVLTVDNVVVARGNGFGRRGTRNVDRRTKCHRRRLGKVAGSLETQQEPNADHRRLVVVFTPVAVPGPGGIENQYAVVELWVDAGNKVHVGIWFVQRVVDRVGREGIDRQRVARADRQALILRLQKLQPQPSAPHLQPFANPRLLSAGDEVLEQITLRR